MDTFPHHDATTAPAASRGFLVSSERAFGFVPSPVARLATSPALLAAFFDTLKRFEAASLAPLEREVLALTVGRRNGCHYCVAMHTATLHRLGADAATIAALREGTPLPEPRLAALARFIEAVLDTRGGVDDATLADFLAAGFDARAALDVVLGVGAYTLSTYANRLTRAPIDAAFAEFA